MATASYEVKAFNYAFDSENKIHSDDVASRYGFKGGLAFTKNRWHKKLCGTPSPNLSWSTQSMLTNRRAFKHT